MNSRATQPRDGRLIQAAALGCRAGVARPRARESRRSAIRSDLVATVYACRTYTFHPRSYLARLTIASQRQDPMMSLAHRIAAVATFAALMIPSAVQASFHLWLV